MNSLVVGGAGFIGSHLCDALIARGDKVIVLDNYLRGTKDNVSHLLNNEKFVLIEGDANDTDLLKKIITEHNVNFIYHLAANSDIRASAEDPSIEFQCTASTTWSILTAMRETGVKNLFFSSTSAVYGEHQGLISEDTEMHPISYYGSAKMASEAFINAFSYMNDFNALIFRFPNVIGPRLTHGVIFDFIGRLRKDSSELTVLGDGTQEKPYIYVSDLIEAITKFDVVNKGINVYNVGVEGATTVRFIAEEVTKQMGLNCQIKYGESNCGWKGDVPKFQYDSKKINKAGWNAKHNSDEAVVLTIESALRK